MSALNWSDDLRLNQPLMDRTHEEFVGLLAQVRAAIDGGRVDDALATFDRLLAHTVEHFAREERWMRAIGLPADNAHALQHQEVLQLMRRVARIARDDARCAPLLMAIDELSSWFPLHAQMMDADLVLCMDRAGFEPSAGRDAAASPASA